MALLAEALVEEWLNRQGYFTIRGAKLGVHEMDILAIRLTQSGMERRHIEVQASINPVSYFGKVPSEIRRSTGRAPNSAKARSDDELGVGIKEWFYKKFLLPQKEALRQKLSPGTWSFELAVHKLFHPPELPLIVSHGVVVHQLDDIARQLRTGSFTITRAAGADLVDLLRVGLD